ncbi:hypothetical protein HGRIS_009218 [Hohenbuehelia grisea]|uniref:THO complex subunit 2 n=1 Tax=Hohenbuehelia grisea TaxID=104357 RepID=A0ABR3J0L7_9AGAR
MDIIDKVSLCLASWAQGGDSECRNILISPHCDPTTPASIETLTSAYHTLLAATLKTWAPKHGLTPTEFVTFVQSVLDALPSSSSTTPSSNASIFGEHLVDIIWALDTALEEVLADTKLAIANAADPSSEAATKANNGKQNIESDKATLTSIVKQFLDMRILSPTVCRERLDLALLASVGLVAEKLVLDKKEIRMRTAIFYKQNKFNLLREQSEGYSKLTTELTAGLGPAHSPITGRPVEPYSVTEDRARQVWEKLRGLIGQFDLDPNRALDVIIDVLSVHLATHHVFFLALLSFSPWAGEFQPPSDITMEDAGETTPSDDSPYKDKTLDEVLSIADKGVHGPTELPTSGFRVLAQVLGFKFTYYQSSEHGETTPKALYLTAALLIREGLINLEDLYHHLSPFDQDMDKAHKAFMTEIQSRISGAKISQLAMAAPLESSSSTKSKPAAAAVESKKPPPEVSNQKAELASALLAVGALKPAIAILTKFPWFVDAHPEIADLLLRVMKHSISSLYESTMVTKERNPSFQQPRARFGSTGVSMPKPRTPVLTLWAPTPPCTSTVEFVFFFPDWTTWVPVCSTKDDLVDVIEPLMRFVGPHISRDTLFLTKFVRLGRSHLVSTIVIDPDTKKPVSEPDPTNPIRVFWFNVLRQYLLPALSLIRGNAVCAVEVWNIIRQYETVARWRLYGEWKTATYNSHPELRVRAVQADRESKGILRRLSHQTIDTLSGSVAKLAHSNPCIFFSNAVNQVMAYDNLAGVVILALRYVTNMGFDVLVYIVLDALSNPNKERVKDDGVNTSDWLQSLASFTGMLFRRYSADLTPMLRYIVHQLHNGQTTEIVVLRELIWKMAGIEPLPSLSDSQIQAMAGGPVLRIEAVASSTRGARVDPGDMVLKSPFRLGKALIDSALALPLLIQVAQQRESSVYKAQDTHMKSLASLYDTTHGVLLQYLELLTSGQIISLNDYATKILPSLAELGSTYGICAPICMQIMRPVLHAAILKSALALQEQEEKAANEEAENRLKAALKAKREPSATSRVASPESSQTKPSASQEQSCAPAATPSSDTAMETDPPAIVAAPPPPESPWLPELLALFDDVKQIAPGNAYEVIGPGFYLTFWQLSTYDLSPPSSKYDDLGKDLRELSRKEDTKLSSSDRSVRKMAVLHRGRRDRYTSYVNALAREFKDQLASRQFTIKRFAREKSHWFAHSTKGLVLAQAFIDHCIQPRCLLSPMDADFCAQIIKIIHTLGTPGFPTLVCYDKILGDHVKVVIFSCSEYEARNYGRFLLGVLTDLYKWYSDEQAFIQDNRSKVGGKTVLHPGLQQRNWHKTPPSDDKILAWLNLHKALRKWYMKLAKCFIDCIQTGEFMHVYNTIIVLKEILPVFPLAAVHDNGIQIDRAMDRFLETEERGDLKILGRAYSASLKKRESYWRAKQPPPPPKVNGASPAPRPAPTPADTNAKNVAPPRAPNGTANAADNSRPSGPTTNTPSGPRAQQGADKQAPISAKLAMESVPRPEVVKRIRPDTSKSPAPVKMDVDPKPQDSARAPPTAPAERNKAPTSDPRPKDDGPSSAPPRPASAQTNSRHASSAVNSDIADIRSSARDHSRPHTPQAPASQNPSAGKEPPQSPRSHRANEETARAEAQPPSIPSTGMPPPARPSQTVSAQELRETAKQSMSKVEDKNLRSVADTRGQNGSGTSSPNRWRGRSSSPSSRPGTRNHSSDSRHSGGRSRSDRDAADDKQRAEGREHPSRRDSLTHVRSERRERSSSARDAEKDDRDRDRGRDRHGDKEKDRDRDRERERERDRERDRDDRDRDRDRHGSRKDRERDRKDRESSRGGPASGAEERGPPTRPDPTRHRNGAGGEESLGKRRRGADDEQPERGSKRSSRKERGEDRNRRGSEKESHDRNRESEKRRKERDGPETDNRSAPEKPAEKRNADGPSSAKALPPSTPSAPRAMASAEASRSKGDGSGRDRHRDQGQLQNARSGLAAQESGSHGLGSLRSRISDKEAPLGGSQAPSNSYRPEPKEDDRDSRKRTLSGGISSFGLNFWIRADWLAIVEREKDVNDGSSSLGGDVQPPKRPRINRHRYSSAQPHALAKKLLPIDPSAGDKRGRKD